MSRSSVRSVVLGLALLVVAAHGQRAQGGTPDTLFNIAMYEDPATGETASKGEFLVFHAGEGELPKQGYFKKHEPGEIAEFHLFVPKGLDPERSYPLLIVYHGGKDGASGKGLCRGMARVSTKEHPVIVLSPNMYTLDAYNELLKEDKLPLDQRRVVVYGHSSGGMGVRSAMVEFARTKGAFTPATLICSSTTASIGRQPYAQTPYIVMAGEKETPEFVKHKLLKNRRATCRRHALGMQQVIREVRYIEMQGHGHGGGKPDHKAVIKNLIRALPEAQVKVKLPRVPDDLAALAAAVRSADWPAMQTEIERLDEHESWPSKNSYKNLRKKALKTQTTWFKDQVKFVAKIGPKSRTWEVLRAFQVYGRLETTAVLAEDTPLEEALYKMLDDLKASKQWKAELEARSRYYEIVAGAPSEEMTKRLEELHQDAPKTEFGGNRTREKLLALQD